MLTFNTIAMKNFRLILLLGAFLAIAVGCSPEDDIKNPTVEPAYFFQDFSSAVTESSEGQPLAIEGWTNFAEAGTVKWGQGFFSGTKYAEMTGYQSGDASNIAWLISAPINMDQKDNEHLVFDVAQAYVSTSANSLDLLVSTDYDGENVLGATWRAVQFNRPPLDFDTNFDFFSSGIIDMSSYTGNIYLAFKYKGSGTNTSIDGTYSIDNIRIFDKK